MLIIGIIIKEMFGPAVRVTYALLSGHIKTSGELWMSHWTGARLRQEAAFPLVQITTHQPRFPSPFFLLVWWSLLTLSFSPILSLPFFSLPFFPFSLCFYDLGILFTASL